jgi:hypothetical protein
MYTAENGKKRVLEAIFFQKSLEDSQHFKKEDNANTYMFYGRRRRVSYRIVNRNPTTTASVSSTNYYYLSKKHTK